MSPEPQETVETLDHYADADGLPIGESDSYLISMVSMVEAGHAVKRRPLLKTSAPQQFPLRRRALLLNRAD